MSKFKEIVKTQQVFFLFKFLYLLLSIGIEVEMNASDTKLSIEMLDAYLAAKEAKYIDIRPGLEKQIVWHNETQKLKTDQVIVYVHGFSASAKEIEPVPQQLAKQLGANLYLIRLRGHGRTGTSLGNVKDKDWFEDIQEALGIAEILGEKIIFLAVSTGSPLALWGAHQFPHFPIEAMIHLSPNFGIDNPFTNICLLPFGRTWVSLIMGKTRKLEDEIQHNAWDYEYPYQSIVPMFRAVHKVKKLDLESIQVPQLIFYSSLDKIVSVKKLLKQTKRLKHPKNKWIKIDNSESENHHVLAGDAVSPSTNQFVIDSTLQFLEQF